MYRHELLTDDSPSYLPRQTLVGLLAKIERRKTMLEKIKNFLRNEEGLTIVEYAVAAGLITATVAGAYTALGGTVEGIIVLINGYLGG